MKPIPDFKTKYRAALGKWTGAMSEMLKALESGGDGDANYWKELGNELAQGHYALLQLMVDAGFVGAEDFSLLYEDDEFSFRKLTSFGFRGEGGRGAEHEEVFDRYLQMYNIIDAFDFAMEQLTGKGRGQTKKSKPKSTGRRR